MRNSKHLSDFLLTAFALLALSASYLVTQKSEKPLLFISKQQSSFNIDNKFWTYFHLGQKRMISSLYWVATIVESDHAHYKEKDLNSWMFLRFNTISLLEPRFYETYSFGAPYLSIVKDDLSGASVIYEKGLKQFPDDYKLLRDAGFHYYFEVANYQRAYEIYKKLSSHAKASPLVVSSLARLESSKGNLSDAYDIILNKYEEIKDRPSLLSSIMRKNLYALKAEIDLNCLNSKRTDCETKDFEGNLYIRSEGKFIAQKAWSPLRIKGKASSGPEALPSKN